MIGGIRTFRAPTLLVSLVVPLPACSASPPTKAEPAVPKSIPELAEDLLHRSRALNTCSAEFRITSGDLVGSMRVDYESPHRMRVDSRLGAGDDSVQQSAWLIDGRNETRFRKAGKATHWVIDFDQVFADWTPVEELIDRNLATVHREEDAAPKGPDLLLTIESSFDEKTGDGQLDMSASTSRDLGTPFQWLFELKSIAENPRVEGDCVRFTTQSGRCEFVVSTKTGFLERMTANGEKGSATIELTSLTLNQPIEPGRLSFPTDPPEGEDVSEQMAHGMHELRAKGARDDVYRLTSELKPSGALDAETRTRVLQVLRQIHEIRAHRLYPEVEETKRECVERAVAHQTQMSKSGASKEMIDNHRARVRESISFGLDQLEVKFCAVAVPDHAPPKDRDAEIFALERDVVAKAFERFIREPILEDFDRDTWD
jgi:hypothetical protein